MKKPLVSFILVAYNSDKYLAVCLDSIFDNNYSNFELIIVDNNSSDKSYEIIKKFQKKYPQKMTVFFNEKNLGYAAANNLAIERANGNYVFILNPDTIVSNDFLLPLVKEITQKNVAAVQPLVYLFDKKTINLSGKLTHFLGFDWLKDYKSITAPTKQQIYSFSGSGVLINKEYFWQIGGFDELYFMYYEDSDLSWKFNLLNKKIIFTPQSILYHDYKYIPPKKYQSLKSKLFYIERNRIITLLKNNSAKTLVIIFPALIFMEIGMILFAFVDGWGITKLKTYVSILQNYKKIRENRKFIQSKRMVSDSKIVKYFESQITFEKFSNTIVRYLVNPMLSGYFALVRKII